MPRTKGKTPQDLAVRSLLLDLEVAVDADRTGLLQGNMAKVASEHHEGAVVDDHGNLDLSIDTTCSR